MPVPTMSVETLAEQIKQHLPLQLIDIRETFEREVCKIDQALHIPMAEIKDRQKELRQDIPSVLYCHHWALAAALTDYLVSLGYKNVFSLVGGINAWAEKIDPSMARY